MFSIGSAIVSASLGVLGGMLPYFAAAQIIIGLLSGRTGYGFYAAWCLVALAGFCLRALLYALALTAAVLGNMLPVPFIILFIRQIFAWMRRHMPKLDGFVAKIESKAHLKGETVQKYGPLGLLIFVAIPLPGTGAWTGALIAALLDMRMRKAVPSILLGVLIAAGIMTAITFGVIHIAG